MKYFNFETKLVITISMLGKSKPCFTKNFLGAWLPQDPTDKQYFAQLEIPLQLIRYVKTC